MSCWVGLEPCIHMHFSVLEPPSVWTFVYFCVLLQSLNSCFPQSCYMWNTVFLCFLGNKVSFYFLFCLAPSTLREGFPESIPFRTAIPKSHTLYIVVSLNVSSVTFKNGLHWHRLFEIYIYIHTYIHPYIHKYTHRQTDRWKVLWAPGHDRSQQSFFIWPFLV